MDAMIDYEIVGEVLIPLENGKFLSNKSPINYNDLNSCNYKLFRKILFQGELLKFYITLQSNKANISDISSIFDKIYFNIEFESTEIEKNNLNANEEEKNSMSNETIVPSFRFYSSNKNIEENDIINKNDFNKEFELISKKEFDKDSASEVYEIIKEINVPENYINSNLLMKVNIYYESNYAFCENNEDSDILNLYQLGILNNVEKYKLLKTIFKEVKVINPLNVLCLKQLEPKIDTTLLQTKINNYDTFNLVDNSLKFSKIFKNINSGNEPKQNENNKNIYINDIRILKDETSFDEKETENIELIKEKLIKEKKLINKNDFNIAIFNKNKYPYIINSGEEYNLLIKIIKNPYINESTGSINKINKSNNTKKNTSVAQISQNETTAQNEVNKIIINTLNDNNLKSSLLTGVKSIDEYTGEILKMAQKRNSVAININKKILPQFQEPLLSIGNLFKKKSVFAVDDKLTNENIMPNNEESTPSNNNMKEIREENYEENLDNNIIDLDYYFDENFKIYYITPVLLDLSSDLFFENINMCIQMKWFNEINRYLIISIVIPEQIYINQYFEASIKIKNISFYPMNLIIQIKDDESNDTPVANSNKKNIENVPSILSQTKIEHLGLVDCGDEKIYSFKFLPLINGYCYLPNLTLIDIYSERKFYFIQSNKIFVEKENKKIN
jgi:hypothetical protein